MTTTEKRVLTLVMTVGTQKEVSEYIFISDQYEISRISEKTLRKLMSNKEAYFTNIGFKGDTVVTTNGAIGNYTRMDPNTNEVFKPKAVVLDRIEENGKLKGYTIFDATGILKNITVDQAVDIEKNRHGFANGKIMHTDNGDIIASIKGSFNIRNVDLTNSRIKKEAIKVDIVFFGESFKDDKRIRYAGVNICCDNAYKLAVLHNMLCSDSKDVVDTIKKMQGEEVAKSYEIIRTSNAGLYGVFTLDIVERILKDATTKADTINGNIVIASTDCELDTESSVCYNKDGAIVGKSKGSDKSEKYLSSLVVDVKRLVTKYIRK